MPPLYLRAQAARYCAMLPLAICCALILRVAAIAAAADAGIRALMALMMRCLISFAAPDDAPLTLAPLLYMPPLRCYYAPLYLPLALRCHATPPLMPSLMLRLPALRQLLFFLRRYAITMLLDYCAAASRHCLRCHTPLPKALMMPAILRHAAMLCAATPPADARRRFR